MKKISLMLMAVALIMASCNPPVKGKNGVVYKSAVDYNDYIVDRQSQVVKMIEKFSEVSQSGADKANAFLTESAIKVDKIITEVEGMPEWKGNSAMRDKGVAMFKYYKNIFDDKYKKIIAITSDGQVTPEEEKEQEIIVKAIGDEGTPLEDAFISAQKDFASKTNMRLEKKSD